MNEKRQKPHSVFGFGFRPTVSVYSVLVLAKNFLFGASLSIYSSTLPQTYNVATSQGIGGGVSRSLMDQFAEVLFSMNKNCFSLLTLWLKEALQPPGFPSMRLTPEQKENFSQQILR